MRTHHPGPILLAAMASVALLAGCDRGTRDEVRADARDTARDVRQSAGQAGDTVANKARDAAITAEVHTRLARDDKLSTLGIDVDTDGGNVVLRGSAPDTAARARATDLARAVDGVRSVRNDLNVQPK